MNDHGGGPKKFEPILDQVESLLKWLAHLCGDVHSIFQPGKTMRQMVLEKMLPKPAKALHPLRVRDRGLLAPFGHVAPGESPSDTSQISSAPLCRETEKPSERHKSSIRVLSVNTCPVNFVRP